MSAFKDWLNGLTSKSTPVDTDELYLRDSSGTPGSKKLTWANLKATLANTFLSLTGGTIDSGAKTVSDPALTVTQTWDNAAVTFTGQKTNITDTASAAGSLIEDWQVGGTSMLSIKKNTTTGNHTSPWRLVFGSDASFGYSSAYGSLTLRNAANTADANLYLSALYPTSIGARDVISLGTDVQIAANSYSRSMSIRSDGVIAWSSTSTFSGAVDLALQRDAAGTLAQRNSTNAQTSRLYGTYTDASNYRRVAIAMTTAGVASITPEGAGTGASGNVLHISGLPTSNPGAGILWNDSGTVKVGT